MTVYVVEWSFYDGSGIEGVFSTLEKAEECMRRFDARENDGRGPAATCSVSEHVIDAGIE